MKTMSAFAMVLGLLLVSNSVFAGNAVRGKELYRENDCATCHSRDGMGEAKMVNGAPSLTTSEGPRIAGLDEKYLITQITAIQGLDPKTEKKTEFTKSMKKQIAKLSAQDIEDLAAYIAKEINPTAGSYVNPLAK